MARPSRYSVDDLLDAALAAVGQHGTTATIGDITEELGAPVGSVYYRFANREHLMVALWLRSLGRFHRGLLEIADGLAPAQQALEDTARHVVGFCRDHPAEAVALTLFRHDQLTIDPPAPLREAVRSVNDPVTAALDRLSRARYGRLSARRRSLVTIAVRQSPYGLVRPYLGGDEPVPDYLDAVAVAAARAILALGD